MNAPMPGMIVSYEKNVGDEVAEGDTVLVLEAMKMEHTVCATGPGSIRSFNVAPGDQVSEGDLLFEFSGQE